MLYKFKECHANKALTDLWVEPTAIWTDTVKIDGNLADCIVFIDSANNKYSFYTKDKVLLDKFMTTIEYHRIFVTQDLVVMNESHFKDIFIKIILGWLLQMEEAWKQLDCTDYQE